MRRVRLGTLPWAVLALLVGLLFLPLWPLLGLGIAAESGFGRALGRQLAFIGMRRTIPLLVSLGLLLIVGLWIYSHVDPGVVGTCRDVVVRIGDRPTVAECQPYGPVDFAVPFGLLLVLLMLASDASQDVYEALSHGVRLPADQMAPAYAAEKRLLEIIAAARDANARPATAMTVN